MHFLVRPLLVAILSLALSAPHAAFAQEQKATTIGETLNRLLRGNPGEDKVEAVPSSQAQMQLSFAPIVRATAVSVVNVYAARNTPQQRSPLAGDPFFERFFGPEGFGLPQQRRQQSLGSGVIVASEGVILTNNHVIENMDGVKVALTDGREFDCDIVLRDPKSDLAVLKIRDKVELQPIEIGDSDQVEVGDLVLAIGNPFGVGQTVTSGIVSAVSRSLRGINDYGYFIQTDAAINPGNSGGALVDMNGRLIGINTAIYSRTGGSVGLGYAIPSNMTKVILRSAETGRAVVVRPWVGADFQTITAEIADSLGLDRPRGAIVTGVVAGGPAEKSGLKPGDIVLEVNGQAVENADNLGYRLETVGVGAKAAFLVRSRRAERTVEIALNPPPETVPRDEIELARNSALAGARVANLSPAVSLELGLPGDKAGVVIAAIARNAPAAQSRLRPGDIVREINGVAVANTRQLDEVARQRSRAWQFVIERAGRIVVLERDGGFFRQFMR